MFLTRLTMRGFKSFADATTLEVEPGVTVVVGPNGSGKSNIVDALAWVLGTHSVKKVRGSAMTDVIFAGSPGRPRGRRARVEIVIDNADGRLDGAGIGTAASAGGFREVRIARTIDEDGLGVYEINGEEVRALDVQELLSDTGLGRELHTIVGQGQLDDILNARPEDRRRYIEEAAGILKHRRRRERAVKKLETVDAHVEKLRTVLRELRRQLRPLEQQAKAADRHAALQAELREVRVQRAARELALLDLEALDAGRSEEEARGAEAQLEATVETARTTERELALRLESVARAGGEEDERFHALSRLGERLRGTHDLIGATRRRLADDAEEPVLERTGEALRAEADALEGGRGDLEGAVTRATEVHDDARDALRDAELARATDADARAERERTRAVVLERRSRRRGDLEALARRIDEREREHERLTTRVTELHARDVALDADMERARDDIQRLDASEAELTRTVDGAEGRVRAAATRLETCRDELRTVGSQQAAQQARAEALRAAAADASRGAGALIAAGIDGVHGEVLALLSVAEQDRRAVAAALGPLGGAVAVDGDAPLRRAVAWLRSHEGESAALLATAPAVGAASLPAGPPLSVATMDRLRGARARAIADVVRPVDARPETVRVVETLTRALGTSYLVGDWDTAVALHARDPLLTFVTSDGDVAGPLGYRIGTAGNAGPAIARAAADEADAQVLDLGERLAALVEQEAVLVRGLAERTAERDAALEALHESDARLTGAAERLERLAEDRRLVAEQRSALTGQRDEVSSVLAEHQAAHAVLLDEERADPEDVAVPQEDPALRQALEAAVDVAREAAFEARVALQRIEDARDRLGAEVARLRREADEVDAAHVRALARREARRAGVARCDQLERVAVIARRVLETTLTEADAARSGRARERDELRAALDAARAGAADAASALEGLRETRHRSELRRAEVQARLGALEARVRTELSLALDEVRGEQPEAAELDDARLVEREDVLVRRIGLLGRVNPLALEEFQALEERHRFLSDQLNDLRRSRRDLEEVITAVDERIRVVFKEAFDDVAREFELTFATVFPGGRGRLVLTGADDLLTAGIEVEARPPGKRVQRLSLLSGGERSLTVLAFVFAIFRARPSPFYVLDEVDAALDDVNLQRLLKVIRSFRGHAQIIMVTHQKRSMEIADLLYGITMGPDAVTKVVSERLRERGAVASLDARASDAPTAALVDSAGTPGADADAADEDAAGAEPSNAVAPVEESTDGADEDGTERSTEAAVGAGSGTA
jgi:chromosome segregation protein